MNTAVAMVGVGNMGGAMAARLLEGGWSVQVFDIDPRRVETLRQQGAVACNSAAETVAGCSALIVCVVDALQVEEVLFAPGGAVHAMRPGQCVLLCPTIAPQDTMSFARRLKQAQVDTIDMPMSGGPARARDGTMSLMVACEEAVFEWQRGLIEALSTKVFRISQRPGDGAATKLVNNLLAGINLVGAAEALALAQRLGLALDTTLDVIEQSSGQSWIASDRMRRAIAGDWEPRAHMTLLQKDTRLAVEAALAAGFEGPLGAAARDVFARASQQGLAQFDDAAVFKLLSQ
jgi:L-threonate 2-dehydrogenase